METPKICNAAYVSNSLNVGDYVYGSSTSASDYLYRPLERRIQAADFNQKKFQELQAFLQPNVAQPTPTKEKPPMSEKPSRRFVRVIVIDPEESIPLEKCVLYKSDEKLTDLTDTELFFEIDIKPLLESHNELRGKTIDKKLTQKLGKETFLEPVKIRDLRMTVVEIAAF